MGVMDTTQSIYPVRAINVTSQPATAPPLQCLTPNATGTPVSSAASWSPLAASEQARALRLLVERVDYDGSAGQVRIRLRSDGITTLARDWAERDESV